MHRRTAALLPQTAALLLLAIVAALPGCAKKSETEHPSETVASDPLTELTRIPDVVEAEVKLVLGPIHDVDRVLEQLSTMPDRLGIDAKGLRALAAASLQGGKVTVDLDLSAEARAEVETLLGTVREIGEGLRETPARVAGSSATIAAQAAKAASLVGKLNASYQAKLMSPFTAAQEKERIRGQIDQVAHIHVEIKAVVGEAKSTVVELPARTKAALAKLTNALMTG
ncbi:MAG: hypothetical protein IAG13_13215 [Deltaproteobacteria bacterium]|nr:hypothetical protein [Nannocystaceae bacterium]